MECVLVERAGLQTFTRCLLLFWIIVRCQLKITGCKLLLNTHREIEGARTDSTMPMCICFNLATMFSSHLLGELLLMKEPMWPLQIDRWKQNMAYSCMHMCNVHAYRHSHTLANEHLIRLKFFICCHLLRYKHCAVGICIYCVHSTKKYKFIVWNVVKQIVQITLLLRSTYCSICLPICFRKWLDTAGREILSANHHLSQ